ncbi:hypothetical protein BKA56DRAFT_217793 [Ilyonectria sp. MPI-CAGE-AT-0026]|nr:hypothetical protein BKA56DRAFT_217793 [Ilyonectria sp. MPI-CAGE-AT-0026]
MLTAFHLPLILLHLPWPMLPRQFQSMAVSDFANKVSKLLAKMRIVRRKQPGGTHRRPMQSVMQGMMHTMRLHALITEPKLIDAQPKPNSKVDLKHKRDCNERSCSMMKQG